MVNKNIIKIGTRGSKLAIFQAESVMNEIKYAFPETECKIVIIKTKGDKILDTALSKIGDKGLFTKELEIALQKNEIDIAVHSLKDLSTELPDGLKLTAVLKRAEFRDVLVHKKNKTLSELTDEDTIATSSLRRIASLRNFNSNIRITDIRGNINTRLNKMKNGHCDGMIMAAAGLQRLGLEEYITEIIDPEKFIPAVAQGAIAIESRLNDPVIDEITNALNHQETFLSTSAERAFLKQLQGGCQVPIGCYSLIKNDNLLLTGFVSNLDGTEYLKSNIEGSLFNATNLARKLAKKLIDMGGKTILDNIRTN